MLVENETHVLEYNVFGFAMITSEKVSVSLNLCKAGRIQGRMLVHELETPLLEVHVPILLPFGAWIERDGIHFVPGRLDGYDAEAYEMNKETVDRIIKSALATARGAVLNP